jgi:hypothetical protein
VVSTRENLDTIDVELELEERESPASSFNVDVFVKEVGTNRRVIIDNQLETTNHDHLGKLIKYASGKDTEVVVWAGVVKRAWDEHRQAIEWLNLLTDCKIGFFLLGIELWQIDDSEKALRFNIVEKPNDWTKTMRSIEGQSNTDLLKLEFWTSFNDAISSNIKFTRNFRARKESPQHCYVLCIRSSAYHVGLTFNTQKQNIGT